MIKINKSVFVYKNSTITITDFLGFKKGRYLLEKQKNICFKEKLIPQSDKLMKNLSNEDQFDLIMELIKNSLQQDRN